MKVKEILIKMKLTLQKNALVRREMESKIWSKKKIIFLVEKWEKNNILSV